MLKSEIALLFLRKLDLKVLKIAFCDIFELK